MESIIKIIAAFFFSILGVLYGGWVFTKLWEWIIVPGFDLAQIGLPIAIGLKLVILVLTHVPDTNSEADTTKAIVAGFVYSTFYLAFGWIVSFYTL